MGSVKSLAKDTAIYGMSSIVGRFLNWCLVPLYTMMFPAAEYGVVTYVYSVVALALIILTYGMETGFFRFANHERWHDPMQVYSTALTSLLGSGVIFTVLVLVFLPQCTRFMECDGHESYVVMMAVCVAIDAFTALPFSYLRYKKRPIRFAVLKLVNIGLNIGLNVIFILLCPWLMKSAPSLVDWWYVEDFGIGYIFLANLIASVTTLLMLWPELHGFRWRFCAQLWREMLAYSAPLLVLGVAGIMNQTIDKLLFPTLYHQPDAMAQLGIYGANYKIAIVMVMFIQAFRFAYEPFIFAQNKQQGASADRSYSDAMKWFLIAAFLIFLVVMFYLDIIRYFISPKYFSGLKVVPIVMIAELMFGVFFNLSVWYKLTDKTVWGMWFSLFGLAITIGLNVALVPRYGYMGCAWAAFCCYGAMMLASYFVGQWKHPIKYPVKQIALYFVLAAALYVVGEYVLVFHNHWVNWGVRAVLLAIYVATLMRFEKFSFRSLLHPIKKPA
ncbi:MAG: lipopolysaccharide biosynthesis protein [Bacteroidales bacterium]|nr:lipopolysaccharide biosynthesis protein [Bacteroidales bacterium]